MNINDLTLAQIKEIANIAEAIFPSKEEDSKDSVLNGFIGKKIIVRASAAGVHYGTLKSIDGDTVVLDDSRRLWLWRVADQKGISLSDVAKYGIAKDSKICEVIQNHAILGACELISTTAVAQASIEAAETHVP